MYRLQLVAHLTAADRESGSPLFLGPGVYTALPLGSTSSHALYIQGHTILDGDVRQTLFQLKKKKARHLTFFCIPSLIHLDCSQPFSIKGQNLPP